MLMVRHFHVRHFQSTLYNTSRWRPTEFVDDIMAGNNDEVCDKNPQRYADVDDNVTQWLI